MSPNKTILFPIFLIATVVQAQEIGVADIGSVVDSYKANQARFVTKYRGKSFAGAVAFTGARENMFIRGNFTGSFEVQGLKISCSVDKKPDIDRLVELNPGDPVALKGVIDDVTMGTLQLKPCDFKKN